MDMICDCSSESSADTHQSPPELFDSPESQLEGMDDNQVFGFQSQ